MLRLGDAVQDPSNAVILQQILGCFTGGRGSMLKTSLCLGKGESRMCRFQENHRRLGLGIGHFRVEQLSSLPRQVDDGGIAAPNHCLSCATRILQACWGRDLSLSFEESGATIRFADALEHYKVNFTIPCTISTPVYLRVTIPL